MWICAVLQINPIALRKTKIAYNFGLSECNRVNLQSTLDISNSDISKNPLMSKYN